MCVCNRDDLFHNQPTPKYPLLLLPAKKASGKESLPHTYGTLVVFSTVKRRKNSSKWPLLARTRAYAAYSLDTCVSYLHCPTNGLSKCQRVFFPTLLLRFGHVFLGFSYFAKSQIDKIHVSSHLISSHLVFPLWVCFYQRTGMVWCKHTRQSQIWEIIHIIPSARSPVSRPRGLGLMNTLSFEVSVCRAK